MFFTQARKVIDSLSFKFGAAFVLVVLLAVGGMEVYTYSWARSTELQHGLHELDTVAAEAASRIDIALASGRGLANHLAATRDVQEFLDPLDRHPLRPAEQDALNAWLDLQSGMMQSRGHSAVFVMAANGHCLASSTRAFIGRDFSFRPYFQKAMAGQIDSSDWVIGSVVHEPRIFSAAPVWVGGRIKGVLVAEATVAEVEQAVADIARTGRKAALVNADGIIIAHSDPSMQYHSILTLAPAVQDELKRNRQFLGRAIIPELFPPQYVQSFLTARDTRTALTAKFQRGRDSRWGAFAPLAERPWVVVVTVPEAQILLPVHRALTRTLRVAVAIALAAFLLGSILGRALLRPLQKLSSAMSRFGAGDTGVRAPLAGRDERGRLAETFNGMADAMQAHQEHLEDMVTARTLDLETTLAEVRTLRGMIPICSYCKKIRDDEGGWWQLEAYIHDHSEAEFSHGICPDCSRREFPRT